MSRFIDRFTSKGLQEQLFVAFVLALALAGYAATIAAPAFGGELNFSAIAGRPAVVSQMPPLNVGAIAARPELPALNLAELSPRRAAQDKPKAEAKPKVAVTAQAKPPARQPYYELRNICNGGYCSRQWVLVQ